MANSNLINDTVKAHATNFGGERKAITNICLHHMAGVLTAKECGAVFAKAGRRGSAHYGVGRDLRIGLYVDENQVAWHAGNFAQNQSSIGIEISNSATGGEWPVSDEVLALTIKLVADCMKRNGIKEAIKGKTLTWHSMFSATACPGNYLRGKMDYICAEVNKILGGDVKTVELSKPTAKPAAKPAAKADSFLPSRGHWQRGDTDARIGRLATFLRKYFPAYTPAAALGNYFGPNLEKSVKEFQRRSGLVADGCVGPKTLAKLKSNGFGG